MWDSPEFMDKDHVYQLPVEVAPGVVIRKESGRAWYQVQRGDTKYGIAKKLSQIPEYAYLSDPIYVHDKLAGFNIPVSSLKAGMEIPIPIDRDQRRLTVKEYLGYAHDAVEAMQDHPVY
jgi:hypothetical protein